MAQSKNRILNSLPQNIFAAVEAHLKHQDLVFGSVVVESPSIAFIFQTQASSRWWSRCKSAT
jgi:hypothetical protein